MSGSATLDRRTSKNAERPRSSHCPGTILDVELAVDIVEVPLERAFRDENGFGDLLVAQARLQALQDRQFPLRQFFAHADWGAALNVRRAQRALQSTRQRRSLSAAELLHVEAIDQRG